MFAMDPLSLAGSIWASETSKSSARDQMRFQESMSSTAHQREVKDLRAAGLNPILSAGGSGAATAPGAGYEADPTAGSRSVASAMEIQSGKANIALAKAQEQVANAAAAKTRKETSILSPRATIMEKINEGLQAVPKFIKDTNKRLDDASPKTGHPRIYRK